MDIKDLIGEATEYDKKEMLEVKKPKSWCKSISAFANGMGGVLIFGISNDDIAIGLKNAERDAEIISEQIKVRLDPIPNFKLSFYRTEDNKKLVIVKVFSGDETPYYYDGDGTKIAYQRIGNESVPVDRAKLKELVIKGSAASYDSLKSKYNFDDYAFSKLKATYKQRSGNSFEDSDYESFGIVDEDGNLTNAGALLADESPIRHSRLFCTRWNGLDKAPGIIDAIDDKEFSGGLINLLQDGTEFVKNNSKVRWKKTSDGRLEMQDYPERPVLEALVNALIHRNYLEVGSEVHVDMFDDRIEIYSPGGMIDGSKIQDRDLLHIPSRRRNPIIADIFNRIRYMDRRGSGFKKILGDYKIQPTYTVDKEPEFYSDNDSFLIILKNLNYKREKGKATIKSDDKKATIKSDDKKVTIKTQQQYDIVLQYMVPQKEYRLDEIAERLGVKTTRTKTILKGLIEKEKVEVVGGNKDRRYRLK